MKLNKLMIMALALTTVVAMNCKKGGAELKAAANEYLTAIEKANAALEAAPDGKAAAKVLNDAEAASTAMEAKFPQLKDFDKTPELADLAKRHGELAMALVTTLAKADDKFKTDPDFAAAMKKVMKTDGK